MKLLTLFAVSLFTAASAAPEATALDAKKLQPFLENYCIKCHGPKKQKGQVRFDQTLLAYTRLRLACRSALGGGSPLGLLYVV